MSSVAGRLEFPTALAEVLRASPCDIVITGGGGWIGQAALEMLESALGDDVLKRVSVFGSSARDLTLRSGRTIPCLALEHIRVLEAGPKLFFHCAFLTKDRLLGQSVDAFIAGNTVISDCVAAAIERSDARGIFMPSSGAVYKRDRSVPPSGGTTATTRELDDDMQANPYGVMKHQDEERFLQIAKQKNIPACIPRLFNLSGPFINKIELYALASMIASCMGGKEITIHAPHRVFRSYIHVADLVALGFAMLLNSKKDDVPVFDTAGEEVVELTALAEKIREVMGKPQTPICRPHIITDKDDVYVGNSKPFNQMMDHHGLTLRSIDVQIRDTAAYLASLIK
ncbi:MAG: NAD(P)-dependent oxidoreductase [Alphaproteobacteria bacterium]|nr:NAD(P)-dependent oxidoreductase [Alphaproteobacteria bacterium]